MSFFLTRLTFFPFFNFLNRISTSRRGCLNDPNAFCYICGEYCQEKQRENITYFVKQTYLAYSGMKLGDQDKSWAPHMVCKTCVENLRQWRNGGRKGLKFGVPMVWREPINHHSYCYFCCVNVKGLNRYKKRKYEFPDLELARRAMPHGEDVPIPWRVWPREYPGTGMYS